jgi:hypothetical protein
MARIDSPEDGPVELPTGGQQPQQPYVHPDVSMDAAAAYQAGIAARRARSKLPKTSAPVAGGPGPSIPRLDGSPTRPGLTMEQHAQLERGVPTQPAGPPSVEDGGNFVHQPTLQHQPQGAAPTPAQLGIMPTDILPEQAKEDPGFRDGQGSMFAVHQPELAMKYGVLRGGKFIPPQGLNRQQEQSLRPETIRDLQELSRLQQEQAVPNTHSTAAEAASSVSDAARAAGTVGNLPGDDDAAPLSDADREKLREAVKDMDEYDFDQWRQATMKDMLNNEEQKRIVEERLKPMDIGDLITNYFVVQRVPIRPGQFEVDLRSTDAETDLALKRLIMEDSKSLEVSDRYYLDKFSLMSVTAMLHAINGKQFPDYHDQHGDFDDDKFRSKLNKVLKLPLHMLASIGVHAMWFDMRVRQLFVAEKLGNG